MYLSAVRPGIYGLLPVGEHSPYIPEVRFRICGLVPVFATEGFATF